MSERSRQLIEIVQRRLAVARWRIAAAEAAFGAAVTVGVVALLLGIGAAAEALLWLGSGARWFFVAVFASCTLASAAVLVARPLLQAVGILPGLDDAAVARLIGYRQPEVADRLSNLLDLAGGRSSHASSSLVEGAIQMLARQVEPLAFERVEDRAPALRAARLSAMPVVGVLAALIFLPGFGPAVDRLLSPADSFDPPAPFTLVVEPGNVEVVRGGDLEVRIRAEGASMPRVVTLHMGREGEERVEPVRLLQGEDGTFSHTESAVRTGLRYRAEAEGVSSPWYRAQLVHRPVVEGLQVVLRPPAYTGLPAQRLAAGVGDFAALPGTVVEMGLQAEGARVDSAAVVFGSGRAEPMELRGRQGAARFRVTRDDSYRLRLLSRDGHENAAPITYTIRTLTDAPPQIRLLEPHDGVLTESLVTRVSARVTDDFGFSRATLFYRLSERDGQPVDSEFVELDIPIRPDVLDQDLRRDWLLGTAGLDLRPGDAVAYFVQVWDNNSVAGYQSARTPTHTLRFPSVREQLERIDEAEDATRGGLDDMRRDAYDARQRFDELRQELMRKQDADWEDERQLERLIEQHRQLEESVQQSTEQMQEVLDRMRENDLISEETQRMYEQLQRVIEEIADPELLEQLRQLQEAMQEMNFEQMLQTMEQFDFDERAFRERLERALELFERMRTAKELEEAARRAKDIAQQEERLSEQTSELQEQSDGGLSPEERQAEQERLAEQQRQAQEAAEALKEQLEQLQDQVQDQRGGQQMSEELQQMQQQLQDAMEQMQENMGQLQDGALQDAQQGQQQLQQQMQQMQQMLQMMGDQMSGQQQQRNVSGLRRAIDDVLTLSFEQESLRDRAAAQRPESPVLRQNAQQQVELAAGLSTVADSLRTLAREIPQMERAIQDRAGDALRQMGEATENLADRQPPQAVGYQKGAMTSLNDLAVLLADLLDQMMDPAGGAGGQMSLQQMLQQLQQMGGDQQQLNQQIQQMLNDMHGQRLSIDQQQRLQQMQQQQRAIRQQLEELIQQGNLDAQTRSQLQRIAEEMEDVARRLESGRLDRDVREQQENILTRLLEAHDSLNERGQKEEREGTRAEPTPRDASPPALPEQEEIDRLRRDLIRALESDYAPDYQELIKRYFELLQRQVED